MKTQMPPQLHVYKSNYNNKLIKTVFPIINKQWVKPLGGIWTSTLSRGKSDWVRWCIESGMDHWVEDCINYVLFPRKCNVITISSLEDLEKLIARFPTKIMTGNDHICFETVAKYYDAIHLTSKGLRECHLSYPYDLYGWDCESTIWFRWCFKKVKLL